ncbi:MAG: hypothetical protein IT350_13050 [Deltaproteobacteria bacterium]|nr:hypothetical protein [Deltaproteobacteria bacterium]
MSPGSQATTKAASTRGVAARLAKFGKRNRVMVLDGDTRAALAVARSLGRSGMDVTVVAGRRDAMGFASKYANEVLLAPPPMEAPGEYADVIVERAAGLDLAAIVPCGGASIAALMSVRRRLDPLAALVMAADRTIRFLADKQKIIDHANAHDVAVPRTVIATSPLKIPTLPFSFPVYVRPVHALVEENDALVRIRVRMARNLDELSYLLRSLPKNAWPCLIQAKLVGEDEAYYAVYRRGEPVVEFSHHRLRDLPRLGGASVLREAAPPSDEVRDLARRFLAPLRIDGPVMMEFVRDRPGGRPCLLKAKPHFWRALQLGIDAGIDFPRLALDVALGRRASPPPAVRYGLRSRWLLGDIEYLLTYVMKGRRIWTGPGRAPGRIEAIARFMQESKDPATRLELESPEDMRPAIVMRKRFRLRMLQKIRSAIMTPFGKGLNRYHGVVIVEDGLNLLDRRAFGELAQRMQAAGLRFVCVNLRAEGRSVDDYSRFVRMCARNSTERFVVVPGADYTFPGGERVLALATKTLFDARTIEALTHAVREVGGVTVWHDVRIGEMETKTQIADLVNGIDIWSPPRHGPFAPSSPLAEEFVARMENSPYLGAFQTWPASELPAKPRAYLRAHAGFLSEMSIVTALESGAFDLCSPLFRLRNDRVSFPAVRVVCSWLNVFAAKPGVETRAPAPTAGDIR